MSFRFLPAFFASVLLLASCGKMNKGSPEQIVVKKVNAQSGSAAAVAASHPSSGFVTKDVSLSLVSYNSMAPAPIVLGPQALRQIYIPVFGATPRMGSSLDEFRGSAANQQALYFSGNESFALGEYFIFASNLNPSGASRPSNMQWVGTPDPDYLRALRAFGGDACRNLLAPELAAPANKENRLVGDAAQLPNRVSQFLTSLLGYSPKEGLHKGSQEYAEAFEKLIAAEPKPQSAADKTLRERLSYNHLCIALATDVRVFTR